MFYLFSAGDCSSVVKTERSKHANLYWRIAKINRPFQISSEQKENYFMF